ncbi:FBD-like protein [Artemisia annua]|uniref:FBD-like protein n=1 Tax=Artemisia annua TaxID=35608 RepID=A0A2U1N1F5_ARTAN|nr:FBD-like protein [Artemisia annua]
MTSTSENILTDADRLSNLPEKVVSRILSLMPTKLAVQTCILSKRWRYSWTLVHSLDFDDIHHSLHDNTQFRRSEVHHSRYGSSRDSLSLEIQRSIQRSIYRSECFSTFVNRVFELLKKSQVEKLRLHVDRCYVSESAVSEWINKAIMLNVCELDIRVNYIEFPSSIFTCKTLTKFTLHFINLYWHCPSSMSLPFLKTLNIDLPFLKTYNIYFRLQNHVDNALKVIHACPVLENLSLMSWYNNEDYKFKIPTLKKLKLTIRQSRPAVNKVILNVPNLEHLFLDGDLCSNFFIEDLSSKVEARVSCEVNDYRLLADLLKRLSDNSQLLMTSTSENILTDADRLSNLPEKVVSRILSLMPTKLAVQTCILSKRWRYSWTLVHSLDFDDIHHSLHNNTQFRRSEVHHSRYGSSRDSLSLEIQRSIQRSIYRSECFSMFVNRVFELLKKSQVEKLRLHVDRCYVSESAVSEWINKAIMLNVCELDIRVNYIEFPSSIFTCKTLTKFTLHFINLYWHCPSSMNLPFLKTLNIDLPFLKTYNIYFRLQNHVDNALKVIHACPVLENLSLMSWYNNEDYKFKIPTLKKLKLTIRQSRPAVNKVILNVPNLEHLFLDGDLCSNFFIEDLSSKVEARVSCEVNDYRLLADLLKRLSGAKYISATTYPNGKPANLKYPNLKRLELSGYVGMRWQLITQILENCSELEYLSIEKPNEGCWEEPEYAPTCMLMSLKTMKYANTTCYWDDMQFLKFILGNSNVLKTLTLQYAPTLSFTEKTRLRKNLAIYAKDCEICFVES